MRFAVLFGSFHTEDVFRDVDIGVWAGAAAPADLDRGKVLSARDEQLLADVMERTARDYHHRAPLLRRAALEAFAG